MTSFISSPNPPFLDLRPFPLDPEGVDAVLPLYIDELENRIDILLYHIEASYSEDDISELDCIAGKLNELIINDDEVKIIFHSGDFHSFDKISDKDKERIASIVARCKPYMPEHEIAETRSAEGLLLEMDEMAHSITFHNKFLQSYSGRITPLALSALSNHFVDVMNVFDHNFLHTRITSFQRIDALPKLLYQMEIIAEVTQGILGKFRNFDLDYEAAVTAGDLKDIEDSAGELKDSISLRLGLISSELDDLTGTIIPRYEEIFENDLVAFQDSSSVADKEACSKDIRITFSIDHRELLGEGHFELRGNSLSGEFSWASGLRIEEMGGRLSLSLQKDCVDELKIVFVRHDGEVRWQQGDNIKISEIESSDHMRSIFF